MHPDGRLAWVLPPEEAEAGEAPGLSAAVQQAGPQAEAGSQASRWACVTDGDDVWYTHPDGRCEWTLPLGAALANASGRPHEERAADSEPGAPPESHPKIQDPKTAFAPKRALRSGPWGLRAEQFDVDKDWED